MQGSWYKYFVFILRVYYRGKDFFWLFIKFLIILKILSIILDIYNGYFPNIFKDSILSFYFLKFYNYNYLNFFYWLDVFWVFVLILFLIFWFFFRIGLVDNAELRRRRRLKEEKLKNAATEIKQSIHIINIQQKNFIIKKKLKNIEKFIKKNF